MAKLESGAARTVILAENDLFERVDPDLVERLFAAASEVVALDCLPTRTIVRADIVIPVADQAEAAGTVVNHSGHAQRFFAAVPRGRDATWRVVARLMPTPGSWATLEDILAEMADALPSLAGAARAAPDAGFRTTVGKVARAPWRMSGRTAHDRAGRVADGVPPEDPDAALAVSMEGAHGRDAPPALLTGYETPGLHSASGSWRFIDGAEHRLRGGDPGVPLIVSGSAAPAAAIETLEPVGEGFLPLILNDPFIGAETTRAAERLMMRAPPPVAMLHPEDAEALSLAAGEALRIDGRECPAPLTLSDAIPRGHVGLSAGRLAPRCLNRRVRVEAMR